VNLHSNEMGKVIAHARYCFMITFVERETTRGDTS